MHVELKVLNKEFYRAKNGIENNSSKSLCYGNLPSYATPGGAALDLVCCEDVSIYPGEVKAIHTGLAIWIGATKVLAGMTKCSFAGIISPRSGLRTSKRCK